MNLSGIAVIKAFVKEGKELFFFRKLNRDNEEANVSFTRFSTMLHVSVILFVESVICVILGYGGYLVYKDVFDVGQLVEYISYFTAIIWPVLANSELIDMTSRGKASLKRISELLDADIDVCDDPNGRDMEQITGEIEFRNLTFSYPGNGLEVLKDLSFTIKAGESIGIIGRTGAGKTTLVDLILRTYNVPEGTVFLDGRDITTIPIRKVRDNAAYVPQDNFLFSDTIANNIAFGADDHDSESVENAAKLADVHDNIVDFSMQTVLHKPSVMILDEATANIDTETELLIQDSLSKMRNIGTMLIVAHRLSTIQHADKIFVMSKGKIIEQGNHSELLEQRGRYYRLYQLQYTKNALLKGE